MQKSQLANFSEWVEELTIEDIPPNVIDKAKFHVANTIAAGIGSLNNKEKIHTEKLKKHAKEGECTVLGGPDSDIFSAYYLNSAYSMMHDYDDYLFMGHTGHSSVFSSLAACQVSGKNSSEFLKGVIIGNELGGRLGASTIIGPHNGQMWSFIHQTNASAIVADVLGGDSEDILNAVAMSLYNPPFPLEPGFMGGDSKVLTASSPGVTGIRTGLFSLSNARGAPRILESEKGFLKKFSFLYLPEMFTGFGESWVTKTLSFKPYPGCAYIQTPLKCVEKLNLKDEIEEIKVKSSLLTVGMENMSRPYRSKEEIPPVNVTFSVPYSLSVYLTNEGKYRTEHLTNEFLQKNQTEIHKMAEKITLTHDWKFTSKIINGVSQGLDFRPILEEKGLSKIVSAVRKMSEEHSNISGGREFIGLIFSGKIFDLIESIDSPLNWDSFNLRKASFENLNFNFGSSVRITTKSGKTISEECLNHDGSCGKPSEETEQMVKEKLEKEATLYFDDESKAKDLIKIVENLEKRDLSELTSLLNKK